MSVSWEITRSVPLSLFNQDYTFRVSWLPGSAQLPQGWWMPETSGLGSAGWAGHEVKAARPALPSSELQGPLRSEF